MERVKDDKSELYNYEYLSNLANSYLSEWLERNNIESLKSEPQNVFNAFNIEFGRKVVRPMLDATKERNVLDVKLLDILLDVYISICSLYNKEVNITGYSYFCNTSTTVFNDWINSKRGRTADETLTTARLELVKKIHKTREDSLSNMLTSGKNPVGTIAILNHAYHWQSDSNVYEEQQKAISIKQLPKLLN